MPPTFPTPRRFTDAIGFALFGDGEIGAAHVMAHRMLDEGRYEEGHRRLGEWLAQHSGCGSEWTHLQWHMAVFELSTGRVAEAAARFEEQLLPAVAEHDALTDGPSLLWRLSLAGHRQSETAWQPVVRAALSHLGEPGDDPYVELHHLLALAGTRDLHAIDAWLDSHYDDLRSPRRRALVQLAWCLRSFAACDYSVAARLLSRGPETAARLGGSRAQNELFRQIAEEAQRRAGEEGVEPRAA